MRGIKRRSTKVILSFAFQFYKQNRQFTSRSFCFLSSILCASRTSSIVCLVLMIGCSGKLRSSTRTSYGAKGCLYVLTSYKFHTSSWPNVPMYFPSGDQARIVQSAAHEIKTLAVSMYSIEPMV